MLLLLPLTLAAQTDVDLDSEWGARFSASIEKKFAKGLHVSAEEEVRMDDNFRSLNRLHTTIAIDYKALPWLKVGMGYALINAYNADSSRFKSPRHRLMVDATGSMIVGDWRFALKERLQATYRTGSYNNYQMSQPLLALKSRISAKYRGWRTWEPYVAFEIRTTLNAPKIDAHFDGTNYLTPEGNKKGEPGWFLEGFDGCYANRYRSSLGVEWKINYSNALKIYVLADFVTDKVVDANAEGTKLKSYTKEKGFVGTIGAEYVFSF